FSGSPPTSRHKISNFTAWGVVSVGIENYYAQHADFDHITLLGAKTSGNGHATTFGYSSAMTHSNYDVEGFNGHGLEINGNFSQNIIHNAGYFDNKINIYVDVAGGA